MEKTDTIAAVATAMSNAGIGIIRISGEAAIKIADLIFRAKNGKKLEDSVTHTIHYGVIHENGQVIDEVLILLMKAPNTYTREDTVEIDCHGGVFVMQRVLEAVIKNGARLAEPGEFTKRAFLNGRIDLSQAESVIDLINAKNEFALKASIGQLRGTISHKIQAFRQELIHETAFIESALDDPEHYSLDGYPLKLSQKLRNMKAEIQNLLDTADNGRILKEGINTVIVGKPNVGKSSILNVLSGSDRAIVTEIAGTTRDALEEQVIIHGISLNVIDTAGIRNTDDVVEKIGVEKAKSYLDTADLILYVVDRSEKLSEEDREIARLIHGKNVIILLNKSDLVSELSQEDLKPISDHIISVSAKEETGIRELADLIRNMFFKNQISMNDEAVITNIRHKNALIDALNSISLVEESILKQMPEDFFSIDLLNAYEALGLIIGESVGDDLADEIFSKFCMGK